MIPSKLQRGQPFKESTIQKINSIIDYLKTQRLVGDNKTIKVNQFVSGVGISAITTGTTTSMTGSAPAGGGDGGVVLARVSAFDPVNGISIVLYENGKENESTGTGLLFCPELAYDSQLTTDDWIIAHKSLVTITGGN